MFAFKLLQREKKGQLFSLPSLAQNLCPPFVFCTSAAQFNLQFWAREFLNESCKRQHLYFSTEVRGVHTGSHEQKASTFTVTFYSSLKQLLRIHCYSSDRAVKFPASLLWGKTSQVTVWTKSDESCHGSDRFFALTIKGFPVTNLDNNIYAAGI